MLELYILLGLIVILKIGALIYYILKIRNRKVHIFIGPTESGKSRAFHHLIGQKDITTVPSLEDNHAETMKGILYDIVSKENASSFKETYGLGKHKSMSEISDMNVTYFFFFKSCLDFVDYEKEYPTYFVYFGNSKEIIKDFPHSMMDKLIVLNNDPENLRKYIQI